MQSLDKGGKKASMNERTKIESIVLCLLDWILLISLYCFNVFKFFDKKNFLAKSFSIKAFTSTLYLSHSRTIKAY